MNLKELTAPCGMDCFNCQAYVENITPEIRQRLASATNKSPEAVACIGCRPLEGRNLPTIKECPTYNCVSEKGLDFCCECNDFPCEKLCPTASRADRLPHNMKVYNLCRIKNIGLEDWSKESELIRKRYYEGTLIPGAGPIIKAD